MQSESSRQTEKSRHAYFSAIFEGNFSNYLNETKFEGFLNGMLDYFSGNKNKNNFDLIKNGIVTNEDLNKFTNILNYLNEGLNKITNLPFDKIILARKLNSVIRAQSLKENIDIDNDFYNLIFSSMNVTNNAIQFAPLDRKKTPEEDTIFNYLSTEIEDFGNIVLTLRDKSLEHSSIEAMGADLIKNNTDYLTPAQTKQIRYDFVSQFHSGIYDIEQACQELFATRECYYPKSIKDQYFAIMKGRFPLNTINAPQILIKLYTKTNNMRSNPIFYSEDEIANFLTYFINYVSDQKGKFTGISEQFTTYLNLWIDLLLKNWLKINKPKIINQLFILVEKIIADPHFNVKKFFIISTAIEKFRALMAELPKSSYESVIDCFTSLFHQIIKKEQIKIDAKLMYASDLTQLGLDCLKDITCNATLVVEKLTGVLGGVLQIIDTSSVDKNKTKIEETTQQLLNNADARNRIPASKLKEIAISFVKRYADQSQINENCQRLFNLTDCQTLTTNSPTINVTTITSPVANATLAPVINQTSPWRSFTNTMIEFSVNLSNTTSNQTTIDLANPNQTVIDSSAIENTQFSLASKIGTAMGFGALAGFLNSGSQVILHIAAQKNCSSSTQRLLTVTLALANSFTISTLPLIYSIIENLANEEKDSLVNSQKLLTCTYAFITSVFLQSLNAATHYALPKKSILKKFFNMLPLFSGLWMLANGEEGAIESLAILGTHILTSLAASSLTYFSLKRLFSTKNQQFDIETADTKVNYDVKNNEIKLLQPLHKEKKSENEALKKTYQFICLPELDEVKKLSKDNLEKLKNLVKTLENNIENLKKQKEVINTSAILNAYIKSIKDNSYILNILEVQLNSAEILYGTLNDSIHLKACEMYTLTRKKDYISAMEKLGNVFKLMETNFKTLQEEIKVAIGYTEASSENFSDEVKTQLNLLGQMISFPLSKVTLYKNRYSNAKAVEKTEKRCKAEVNQGFFNAIAKVEQPAISKRNKKASCSNRNTFDFSSGSHSNFRDSTGPSSGESELSMISGNSAYNPMASQ